ncbi:MAG: hypothetical protein COB08_001200 [Rhodobacteraceae bacterium]|nr:hypothetical protein [Paracoccaceae bacterium]
MKKALALGVVIGLAVSGAIAGYFYLQNKGLNEAELEIARTLSLASLRPLPADLSNAVADDPAAIALGEALFSEGGLSANGEISCATCHIEDRQFQDDLALSNGIGTTDRRAMPLRGAGYALWLFWDGRKDSLWSQALGPMESSVEHGFTRSQVAAYIAEHYRRPYEALFGALPALENTPAASPLGSAAQQAAWAAMSAEQQDQINRVFANTGKAIAAFERTLLPLENRFDRYVAALLAGQVPSGSAALTQQEIDGFKIFAGKGACVNCHNGPRFTDEFFHNTGIASPQTPVVDFGRLDAVAQVEADEFNCLGRYSDAAPARCGTLRFMSRDEHLFERAYKSPSLRGVADRPPYMHAGQLATLALVVEHYNRAMPSISGHTELEPLGLTTAEKAALLAFLKTL